MNRYLAYILIVNNFIHAGSIQDLIDLPDASQRPLVVNAILDLDSRNITDLTGLSNVANIDTVTHIYLSNNPLDGNLDLSACVSLTHLYLDFCEFTAFPIISSSAVRGNIKWISLRQCSKLGASVLPSLGVGDYTLPSLNSLDLDGIGLLAFPTTFLENIASQLVFLSLANNPNMGDPGHNFSAYTSLNILALGNTGLTVFPSLDAGIKPQISHLVLDNNPNMGLPSYATASDAVFNNFSSLIYLNVGDIGLNDTVGNDFTHLRNHVDPVKGQLKYFYFGYNAFNIGNNLNLSGFSSLTHIGAQGIGLTTFPVFDGTGNLPDRAANIVELQLGEGDNITLPTFSSALWPKLTVLILDNLPTITAFPSLALADIKDNIETLYLRNNSIVITVSSLNGFLGLKKLDLSSCTIVGLVTNSFSECSSLEDLNLAHCDLSSSILSPTIFNSLSSLKKLNLSNCGISSFTLLEKFPSLTNLTSLMLNDNNITSVTGSRFQNLSNLKTLDLSGNINLNSLNSTSFTGLSHLEHLILSGITNATSSKYNQTSLYAPLTHLLDVDLVGTVNKANISVISPLNGLRAGVRVWASDGMSLVS